MKLLHIMIRAKNIDESLKFYTELLDMNLTQQAALDDADLYYLSDEDGQTQLELTYNREKPVTGCYTHGSGFGHLAFETDSMDKFTEKMNKLGYAYSYEPFYMPEVNMMIAFIKDPDGYEVEIMAKS